MADLLGLADATAGDDVEDFVLQVRAMSAQADRDIEAAIDANNVLDRAFKQLKLDSRDLDEIWREIGVEEDGRRADVEPQLAVTAAGPRERLEGGAEKAEVGGEKAEGGAASPAPEVGPHEKEQLRDQQSSGFGGDQATLERASDFVLRASARWSPAETCPPHKKAKRAQSGQSAQRDNLESTPACSGAAVDPHSQVGDDSMQRNNVDLTPPRTERAEQLAHKEPEAKRAQSSQSAQRDNLESTPARSGAAVNPHSRVGDDSMQRNNSSLVADEQGASFDNDLWWRSLAAASERVDAMDDDVTEAPVGNVVNGAAVIEATASTETDGHTPTSQPSNAAQIVEGDCAGGDKRTGGRPPLKGVLISRKGGQHTVEAAVTSSAGQPTTPQGSTNKRKRTPAKSNWSGAKVWRSECGDLRVAYVERAGRVAFPKQTAKELKQKAALYGVEIGSAPSGADTQKYVSFAVESAVSIAEESVLRVTDERPLKLQGEVHLADEGSDVADAAAFIAAQPQPLRSAMVFVWDLLKLDELTPANQGEFVRDAAQLFQAKVEEFRGYQLATVLEEDEG